MVNNSYKSIKNSASKKGTLFTKINFTKKFRNFIISLLLHLLLIIFFLFYAFRENNRLAIQQRRAQQVKRIKSTCRMIVPRKKKPKKKQDPQKKKEQSMPAALLPKRSDQGTEVVFDNRIILTPDEANLLKKKKVSPSMKEQAKIQASKPKPKKQNLVTKIMKKIKRKSHTKKVTQKNQPDLPVAGKTVPKNLSPSTKASPSVKASPSTIETKKSQIKHAPPSKTVAQKEITKPQKVVQKKVSPQKLVKRTKKTSTKKIEPRVRVAKKKVVLPKNIKRVEPTKKKSLLSLAKCYLDHEKGNSSLMRHGANRPPSLEEMKYICYEKQIEEHIISSWKMMSSGTERRSTGSVSITFLIDQHGNVNELQLLQSSGDSRFDDTVLKCIKSTTFPPVPKHFGVKMYRPRGGYTLLPSY